MLLEPTGEMMNMSASEQGTPAEGLAILIGTFASRARNWIVLARNLVPVVGVYVLGWSKAVTVLSYWFDGVCLVGLLVMALCVRMLETKFSAVSWGKLPVLLLATVLIGLVYFAFAAIPYWIAYGALNPLLNMDLAVAEVWHNRSLEFSFLTMLMANAVACFQHGGYLTLSAEQLQARWEPEIHLLIARALAMAMLVYWNLGMLLVPAIALLLTGLEVWPSIWADIRKRQEPDSQRA
jgi:hypothetical protein